MAIFDGPSQRTRGPVALDKTASSSAASTVAVSTRESAGWNRTVFTFVNFPITIADAITAGGAQFGALPEGVNSVACVCGNLTFTTTSAIASTLNSNVACVWAVGEAVEATDATLNSTQANIIPSTSWNSSTTINVANTATTGFSTALVNVNGSGTAKSLFLNVGVTTATDIDADATVAVNGSVVIVWQNVADF